MEIDEPVPASGDRPETPGDVVDAAWETVVRARMDTRPQCQDYIDALIDSFVALEGDRCTGADSAVIGGIGLLGDRPVTVIGHQKGASLDEKVSRNFGMPHPRGFRKAVRLMEQAEKFHRPVICFVDTPGAYPGKEAEQRGQAVAIAESLLRLSGLRTPVLSVVVGEGGSGGALALALCDHLIMLEHSFFSVISPEGCAAILWKDASRAREAARSLRLTARDLLEAGFADEIVAEPAEFTVERAGPVFAELKARLTAKAASLSAMDEGALVEERQAKYLRMGRIIGT